MEALITWLVEQKLFMLASFATGALVMHIVTNKLNKDKNEIMTSAHEELKDELEQTRKDYDEKLYAAEKTAREDLERSDKKCEARLSAMESKHTKQIEELHARYKSDLKLMEDRHEEAIKAIKELGESSERRIMAMIRLVGDIKQEVLRSGRE